MTGLSTRDRALAVVAVIAVAILVGMASHPAAGSGAGLSTVGPVVVFLQTLLWLVIAADFLAIVAIVDALWSERHRVVPGGRKRSLLVYLAALVPTTIAAALITLVPPGTVLRLPLLSTVLGAMRGRAPAATRHAAASAGADVLWISLLLAGLIVVLFLGWFFWGVTGRPKTIERPRPAAEQAVVEVLEQSMDALRAIADPRRAIIAAYSAMDSAMARAGLARRPAEAPAEFLARILRSTLDISLDARRLTYLFEVAKFSDHDVDDSMRTNALMALGRIRDQISAAASA